METDCDHLGRSTYAKTLLTLTEVIRVSLEFDAFHDPIAEICRRYRIAELSVFGSVARGEDHTNSDVDLLYVSAPDATGSLWELWELRDELAQLFGRKVDLVPKDNLHWVIRDRVLAEARHVYAA